MEEVKAKISFSYRYPNTNDVFTYNAEKFFFINDLKEIENLQGFIFAPFDHNNGSVFILEDDFIFADDIFLNEEQGLFSFENISKEEYLQKGEKVKSFLLESDLKKLVLSRVIALKTSKFDCLKKSYNQLLTKHLNAFVYYISIEKIGTWFGATPEKLLVIENQVIETVALAGTKKINDSNIWGDKEIEEQEFVSDYMSNNFNRLGLHAKKSEKFTLKAGNIKHLCNTFTLKQNNFSFSNFINVFHPTPAVAGVPKEQSIELIKKIENQDRGFYAGYLGLKLQDDVKIFVNLRCANYQNNKVNIFVGGGYTKDSDIISEWEETVNKSKTILDTLKLD